MSSGLDMKRISTLIAGRKTVVVERSTLVSEGARLMSEHPIGAVPVLDGERVAGIFTERDVMARVVAAGRHPACTSVGEVMSTELVVADCNENHDTCLRRLQQARVRHLLVLNGGRLVGIVSLRDLLAVELTEKDEEIDLLNAYVHYIPADVARGKIRS